MPNDKLKVETDPLPGDREYFPVLYNGAEGERFLKLVYMDSSNAGNLSCYSIQ